MNNKLAAKRVVPWMLACGLAVTSGQSLAGPPATAAPGDPFAAFTVVSSQELGTMRARSGDFTIVSSNQEFKSAVRNIQFEADAINTGTVTVGKNAFSGFSGMAVNVLNTGNGNAINAGMSVTINLH